MDMRESFRTYEEHRLFHGQEKKKLVFISLGGTISSINDPIRGRHVDEAGWERTEERLRTLLRPIECRIATATFIKFMERDSSDLPHHLWSKVIREIDKLRAENHIILLLTGTDTASRIGTAITFGLQGQAALDGSPSYITTPICIVSSQKPLMAYGTDAELQFQNAVAAGIKASDEGISEVIIVNSPHQLLRACRTAKINDRGIPIYDSPNYQPIGHIIAGEADLDGVEFNQFVNKIHYGEDILKQSALPPVQATFKGGILTIGLNQLVTTQTLLDAVKADSCTGVVLQTFGSGNGPFTDQRYSVERFVRRTTALGKPVVLSSSIHGGTVKDLYEAGRALTSAGGISSGDMTLEASELKLGWLMRRREYEYKGYTSPTGERLYGIDVIRYWFERSMAGERSDPPKRLISTKTLAMAS